MHDSFDELVSGIAASNALGGDIDEGDIVQIAYEDTLAVHFADQPYGTSLDPARLAIDAIFNGWRIIKPLIEFDSDSHRLIVEVESVRRGLRGVMKVHTPKWLQRPERRARFLEEAEITKGLHHPNLVEYYDSGIVNGVPYLIVKKYDCDLVDVSDEEDEFPCALLWRIGSHISRALENMHTKVRRIHSDVKPENIMLVRSKTRGTVGKLIDMGSAMKLLPQGAVGLPFITPAYSVPTKDSPAHRDTMDDKYALVVSLLEMLASQHLQEYLSAVEGSADWYEAQTALNEALLREVAINSAVPSYLKGVVVQVLEHDPAEMPSMIDLSKAFDRASREAKKSDSVI